MSECVLNLGCVCGLLCPAGQPRARAGAGAGSVLATGSGPTRVAPFGPCGDGSELLGIYSLPEVSVLVNEREVWLCVGKAHL